MTDLRRRDFLKAAVLAAGAYATVKIGVRLFVGPSPPLRQHDPQRLAVLSTRQEAIVTAVALAMVGPAAEMAYEGERWDPAAGVDRLLAGMALDQQQRLGLALHLLEEWTPGLVGFSGLDRPDQRAMLHRWSTSGLELQRSVWGFLHAATCSSFSAVEAGWEVMGYPGPCVAGQAGAGRPPGQTARFQWDEVVP